MVRYEVYRGTNPYFAGGRSHPGFGSAGSRPRRPSPIHCVCPALINYYYVVVAIDAGEAKSPMANRVGVFHFGLTPGGQ